jgi:hypothetical protein
MADDDFIIESHGEAPGSRHGISGPVEFIIEEIPVYEMDSDEDP